jgi:hypothetical protein
MVTTLLKTVILVIRYSVLRYIPSTSYKGQVTGDTNFIAVL